MNGILLVNKPRGLSSNKVVNKVKYFLKAEKAGHLGTLDVLGDGLLPVTLGKGTKLFDFFLNKDKVYKTTFKFGETSDTLDLEGDITYRNNVDIKEEDIKKILPEFIGEMEQMPPLYSAKKINGQASYALARMGINDIKLIPKKINIYNIKLIRKIEKNTFEFLIHCSSGTYIRSICRDMATRLSTFGIMLNITRTKCGDFDINNSYSLSEIENGNYSIINLDELFNNEKIILSKIDTEKVLNGIRIKTDFNDGEYKLYSFEEQFIGIASINNGKIIVKLRLL